MKKNIITKILIILTIFLVGNNTVKAADITFTDLQSNENNAIILQQNGGPEVSYHSYVFKNNNTNTSVTAYCLNPGYVSFKTNDAVAECTNLEATTPYNRGVIAIINSSNYETTNNKDDYVATGVALRVFESFWSSTTNYCDAYIHNYEVSLKAAFGYHMTLYNDFSADQDIKAALKKIDNKQINSNRYEKCYDPAGSGSVQFKNVNSNNNNMYRKIKELILVGLKAAADKSISSEVSIDKNPTFSHSNPKNDNNNYQRTVEYYVIVGSNKDVYADFNCATCGTSVNYKFYIEDDNNKTTNSKAINSIKDVDLSGYDKNKNGKVKIKIEFTSNEKYENCRNIHYTLGLKNTSDNNKALNCKVNCGVSSTTKCQGFIVEINASDFYASLQSGGNGNNGNNIVPTGDPIPGDIRLCEPDCNDLKQSCEAGNQDDCKEFDDEWGGTCVECTAKIDNAKCSATTPEMDINEGYEDTKTCDQPTKVNVLACVINNKDKAGNSYQATTKGYPNNKYCSVWCKEDYHFTLPGEKEVNSGRYFSLQATINGTKTCYTSKIDVDSFKADLTAANNARDYKEAEKIYKEFDLCSTWSMNYKFNPEVHFDYEETYMDDFYTDKLDTIGSPNIAEDPITLYCTDSKTNESYGGTNWNENSTNGCSSGWTTNRPTEDVDKYTCDSSGNNCKTEKITISNATYIRQKIDANGSYITPTQAHQLYPSGKIAINKSNNDIENGSALENKLPVGLGTKQGVYAYSLVVENLGEDYATGALGRIWGSGVNGKDSVISVILNGEEYCQIEQSDDGGLMPETQVGDTHYKDGVYVCAYKVNCPDCPVVCDPDGCYDPTCPEGNCPVTCDKCLFTNGSSNVSYRPVTTEDMNPNDRDLGANWKYDENSITTALELKAYETTKEIEKFGESIYASSSDDDGFVIRVELDGNMINWIKDYNKDAEKHGGYANNSLKCYDHKNSNDGQTYENVYCYSTFIDELIYYANSKGKTNKIEVNSKRLIGSDAKSSDVLRENNQNQNGYWVTWSEWTTTTTVGLSYYNSRYGEIGIGPSWK